MSNTAESAVREFLAAFSRLDLDAMRDCFDPDATAFVPVEYRRERLDGTGAIGDAFAAVLAEVRASGATSLSIVPEDLRVHEWGDTAVATFHRRIEHLSRRTVVLRCRDDRWRIVHLHASNAPAD